MNLIKSLLCSLPSGLTLALLAIAPGMAAAIAPQPFLTSGQTTQLAQSSPPPPPTNPGSSSAGGRRNPTACPQDGVMATTVPQLTALSPTTKPGITLAARPTFLVFVPKTSAKTGEFSIRDRKGSGVYRTTLALTNTPGIISLSLPDQTPPLEIGQQYVWSFAVICNPDDRVDDRFVTGTVQRTEFDATRLRQIEQALPQQRIALYQENGVWYDALALLFQLKHRQANDLSIRKTWDEFLRSGGVDTLIDHK